ncbi:hypothetical protein IHE45_01G018500 [Dioscorea alata]|uniref:Uncharacterized protein n=1 Tax=Dioscorea alata TaxID=55571 RepID=A0ACB7WSH8_DIOAL|nr:hypothetical protein IHE45_01G018500 [Dioscorea alata]
MLIRMEVDQVIKCYLIDRRVIGFQILISKEKQEFDKF